jgi:hypothetical protein
VDTAYADPKGCWITEMNWPLAGAGEYSPAPGKPCVSEEEQANYIVRYFVICLASGFIERIYWWQLAAPGYGLIDNRGTEWRKRPGYFALRQMVRLLEGSRFLRKAEEAGAEVYWFEKAGRAFAVCWTRQGTLEHEFPSVPALIIGRDGEERPAGSARVRIMENPQYVFTG